MFINYTETEYNEYGETNELNEVNDAVKNYTNNLINLRPDFIKMIHDSYIEFDLEELENTISSTHNEKSEKTIIHSFSNKNLEKKIHPKGFYQTIEQFNKGLELEKWDELMSKIVDNKTYIKDENSIKSQLEIKQVEFMKPNEVPKKPEKKININNTKSSFRFKFKSEEQKIISFSQNANINSEKVKKYTKEILYNYGDGETIKLVDIHKENKLIFINKLKTKINESNEVILKNPDLKSIEKRSEILVSSRLIFIEKVARTIFKFLIALKKLYKSKKEKEKMRGLQSANSVKSLNSLTHERRKSYVQLVEKLIYSNSVSSIIKDVTNEKFKKIREIISSQSIQTLLVNNIKSKTKENINLKKFKKLLNIKSEQKENEKKKEKLSQILNKVKLLKDKEKYHYEEPEQYFNYEKDEDEDEKINENKDKNYTMKSITINGENNFDSNVLKKRKSLHNNQIADIVNDFVEEKLIMPKKKLNQFGLKMFIKEEINKINKK